MPTNKNALLRYQILDRCFSNRYRKYTIEDLVDAVNEALYDMYGSEVSMRQIRDDIKYMRDRTSYNAPIEAVPFEGKRCYYRYSDPNYTIFNNELTPEEVTKLCSTINMLGRLLRRIVNMSSLLNRTNSYVVWSFCQSLLTVPSTISP